MSTDQQQTAWQPNYLAAAGRPRVVSGGVGETQQSAALLVGLLVVLALASAIQAVLYPELLGDIFARL